MAVKSEKSAVLIMGGGVVKHHINNANLMRNGSDYTIFINTGQVWYLYYHKGGGEGISNDEEILAYVRQNWEWLWYDMISSFTFRYSLGVRGWKCLFFPFFLIITHSLLRAEHFTTMIDSTNKGTDYEASMSEKISIELWSFNLIIGNNYRNSMDQIREHLRMRPSVGERLNPMHPLLKWETCNFTEYAIISWGFYWLFERKFQFFVMIIIERI